MPADCVRTVLVILFLVPLFLGSLAGCGGGGGSPGQTNNAVQLRAIGSGSLAVTIANLPAGASAAVRVSGPGNFTAELTASQTLDGLAPGNYTIAALPAVAGPVAWIPVPATQDVTVSAGASAAASVVYTLPPARLGLARAVGDAPVAMRGWKIVRAAP